MIGGQFEDEEFPSQWLYGFSYHAAEDVLVAFVVDEMGWKGGFFQSKIFPRSTNLVILNPAKGVAAPLAQCDVSHNLVYMIGQSYR